MRFPLSAIALTITTALAAGSEGAPPQKWVQGKVAYVKPDGCNCLKDVPAFGAGVGEWFNARWGAELDFLSLKLEARHSDAESGEQHALGSALFNLAPDAGPWKPYLRAGLGGTSIQSPYSLATHATTRLATHLGGGVQYFFGDHGLTSLEVRSATILNSAKRSEVQILAGLGVRTGAPARVQAPAPAPAAPPPPPPAPVVAPPPPPVAVAPPPPPPPPPAPEVVPPLPPKIVLDETMLHFANDSAELPEDAASALAKVARSLMIYAGAYEIVVTGHTSSTGNPAHNKALSLRRAKAVAGALAALGLPAERLRTAGAGPDRPLEDNGTPEGRARNRRVEIEVKAHGVEVRRTETAIREAGPRPAQKTPPKPR